MNRNRIVLLALSIPFAACDSPETALHTQPPSAAAAKLALASDPGAALSVVDAKKQGPKDAVVVAGRVHDITKGVSVLKLMDKSLDYCGEIDKTDRCPTPWDYCCDTPDDRAANSLLVEFRNADGEPIATPALPNTRLCDHVKVRGKMVKDEHGNLVLLGDGIFQVQRPNLPDNIKWPQ